MFRPSPSRLAIKSRRWRDGSTNSSHERPAHHLRQVRVRGPTSTIDEPAPIARRAGRIRAHRKAACAGAAGRVVHGAVRRAAGRERGPTHRRARNRAGPLGDDAGSDAIADGRACTAAETAAVFANPIFDPQDPRVGHVTAPVALEQPRSPRFAGLPLTRLPFSRTEAQEIAALAPESVTVFLGFDATRERAVGRALSDYRFVHFATHGVVNQTLPSLSSVVLSLVDRAGRRRDGF